jgi:hypothetical protein
MCSVFESDKGRENLKASTGRSGLGGSLLLVGGSTLASLTTFASLSAFLFDNTTVRLRFAEHFLRTRTQRDKTNMLGGRTHENLHTVPARFALNIGMKRAVQGRSGGRGGRGGRGA